MNFSSMSTITELKAKFTSVWLSALLDQAPPVFSDLSLVNFVLLVLWLFGALLFVWNFFFLMLVFSLSSFIFMSLFLFCISIIWFRSATENICTRCTVIFTLA